MKLRRCESKAKTHEEQERCLRQYKIDVLKLKEEKSQAQPMFKDTDKILVHRDGVDYQAELAPLLGGGGAGLDDIINAPVVKGPKYTIWEDVDGVYTPMTLTEGDGSSGSKFLCTTTTVMNKTQVSIDGTIQYKSSMDPDGDYASICMAQVKDLTCVAIENGSPSDKYTSEAMGGGCFHSHVIKKSTSWVGDPVARQYSYILELTFTNCNGDTDTLQVDVTAFGYVAMRREDIDLREMEALDAEIKEKRKANRAARKLNSLKNNHE